MHSTY